MNRLPDAPAAILPAAILIVEDDRHTAAYLELNLRQSGYRIAGVAHHGMDALRLAETTLPDAIIMDILLPGDMDGIEAAARIRRQRDLPILYLTAHTDPKLFDRARITEPSAYLLKPFNPRELYLAIELAIQRHIEPFAWTAGWQVNPRRVSSQTYYR